MDTVVVLAECPHVDVNWQDSEGNTALITAAQAGKTQLFPPRAEAGEQLPGGGLEGGPPAHALSSRDYCEDGN